MIKRPRRKTATKNTRTSTLHPPAQENSPMVPEPQRYGISFFVSACLSLFLCFWVYSTYPFSEYVPFSYLGLAGCERMEKTMETTTMGYIGTTLRIHSFIPSYPKVSSMRPFKELYTGNSRKSVLPKRSPSLFAISSTSFSSPIYGSFR